MSGSMYLVRGEELVEMTERPYELEDHLQQWIAQHPALLAGDQINSDSPRRWLLISRELAVSSEAGGAGRWSLDHLFFDQDAVPTLIEVKRSSDTRIRREVVGQMLDYAANGPKYWPIEAIRAEFIANCQKRGEDADARLADFLGPDADTELFWQTAKTNLETGRLRLVFVADVIPPELRRVIEFLNAQMDRTEVLAVEVKQFVGQGLTTLVPRVLGQTEQSQQKKVASISEKRQWDEESFFANLFARRGAADTEVARKLLDWARPLSIGWGKGKQDGSFFPLLELQGVTYWTFSIWTSGSVEIQFQHMKGKSPFDREELRVDLATKLKEIPGMPAITRDALTKRPTFSLSLLAENESLKAFTDVFDWYLDMIRAHSASI